MSAAAAAAAIRMVAAVRIMVWCGPRVKAVAETMAVSSAEARMAQSGPVVRKVVSSSKKQSQLVEWSQAEWQR